MPDSQHDANDYTVGWVCALPSEMAAAMAMLEEVHPDLSEQAPADHNNYVLGQIRGHNVVIACLPAGVYGTTSAATVAKDMLRTFKSIRFGLMVGIGGGAPSPSHDIRLGDIVVSQPSGTTGGVVQYDRGKDGREGHFERTGSLNAPPQLLLTALGRLQANHLLGRNRIPDFLTEFLAQGPKMKKTFGFQGESNDCLFQAEYEHASGEARCEQCDVAQAVQRDARDDTDPVVHYGTIASGNHVIKNARTRDQLSKELGVICFEMEAAGLMQDFPCVVIRGICDYSDTHKNKAWQGYAATVAAAFAKELLQQIQPSKVEAERRIVESLGNIEQKVEDVHQTTLAMKAVNDAEKIHRWLSPPDPSTNANHAKKLRHDGTGVWLLAHPSFRSWQLGSRQHLWLHGLAGCGKTVLSTTVLDHLAGINDRLLLSFFFDFSDTMKQSVDGMLRSLAFQLYQQLVGTSVLDASFQTHNNGYRQPTTKEMGELVTKMLANQKVSIVLDALDESTMRDDFLSWMKQVCTRPELHQVQLICTSRPELEFLRGIPELIGEDSCVALDKKAVDGDIGSFVAAQLVDRRDFREKGLSRELSERIQSQVGNGADGMFRWAFCQLESLAQCRHEAAIESALGSLPRNLDETYKRMLENIPKELKSDALRLLQFLLHLEQPLRLADAVEVIATQTEGESTGFDIKRRLFREADVLDYCPSLVVIVHAGHDELHLSHFSVKEYLLTNDLLQLPTASGSITKTCLTYLTDIGGRPDEVQQKFCMARFAAKIWVRFAASAEAEAEILQQIVRFLQGKASFQRWCRLHQQDRSQDDNPGPARGSPLYYACFGGLYQTARQLVENGEDIDAQGGEYGNALQAALSRGHVKIVKLLLEKGADADAKGGWRINALETASFGGCIEVVKLLLGTGVDAHAQSGYYGNALQAASLGGCIEVVKLLLEKGVDAHAQGGYYGNALQAASLGGYIEVVKLLLEKGADADAQGGQYGNALQAATSRGHVKVVKLLLEKGVDAHAQGGYYGNALQAALFGGYIEVVKLLLEKGVDADA